MIHNDTASALEGVGLDAYVGFLHRDRHGRVSLAAWQSKKQEKITHPYLDEKIPRGLVPYAQALLLARYLRNDLDEYPPFL